MFVFLLENLFNEKYFTIKEKINLVFKKIFSFYFFEKTLSRNYKRIRNVILFTEYIKFDP